MSTPNPDFPTRRDAAEKLKQLIGGVMTRDKAAAWAGPWLMRFDEFNRFDRTLFDAIVCLAAADSISTDRPYLYDTSDFEQWLIDLTEGS
ncbi:hypothetical protein EP7_002501 [Isosphaeraceae bacterium EP7]